MSNGGGGGGGGEGRVKIPENARKTIQSIREITGKQHSDEDIYSLLTDCSMDPNETTQKLLYLDTFHEVKRRCDCRKETSGTQGHAATRSRRGNFSSKYVNPEALAGRNTAFRRENGVNHMKDDGYATQKKNNNAPLPMAKASIRNGPSTLPNGNFSWGRNQQLFARNDKAINDSSVADMMKLSKVTLPPTPVPGPTSTDTPSSVIRPKQGNSPSSLTNTPKSTTPSSASGAYSSASDSLLEPYMTLNPRSVSAIKCEVMNIKNSDEQNQVQENSQVVGSELSKNDKASNIANSVNKKMAGKTKAIEADGFSEPLEPSSQLVNDDSLALKSSSYNDNSSEELVLPVKVISSEGVQTKASSPPLPETAVSNGHVIFPNHFKVPEALNIGFCFGSFGADSESGMKYGNGSSCDTDSAHPTESTEAAADETARDSLSSCESDSSTVQVDNSIQSECAHVVDQAPQSALNVGPNADSKADQWASGDQSKHEMMLLTEGNQNHSVQIVQTSSFEIMPTLHGSQHVQFEGHETQGQTQDVCPPSFAENSASSSSLNATPTPTPSVQNSLAPQFLFRPPYPPNYFPYGHYLNPYFFPPMHQFLSHSGIPQQPSTGNAYLTSAATAPGVKFPLAQFKPGNSGGNLTPIGYPPLYGSYGSSPLSFNPGLAVTSGGSTGNEELLASQLKESHIYTTGPLNEVSAWIPPGQDISGSQLNSLYPLPHPGQHLTLSSALAGHGPLPGIYPPVQTMNTSTVNPLIQQSQAVSGIVETMGPPPTSVHQQPQVAHINWNSGY